MIFKKRVSFAIKALGIYWLLYLISSFVFGWFFTAIINYFILFPSSLFLDGIVEYILNFIGFSRKAASDLNMLDNWLLVRNTIYYFFYTIHIFIISFLISIFLFYDKKSKEE